MRNEHVVAHGAIVRTQAPAQILAHELRTLRRLTDWQDAHTEIPYVGPEIRREEADLWAFGLEQINPALVALEPIEMGGRQLEAVILDEDPLDGFGFNIGSHSLDSGKESRETLFGRQACEIRVGHRIRQAGVQLEE